MECSSLLNDVGLCNNFTTSSSQLKDRDQYTDNIRHLSVKIGYVIIATVGILDNLFVIIVFALFIKITDKTMNILVVNQSIIDFGASVFLLLTTVLKVYATGMSRDSQFDQFVCHVWVTKAPLWCMMVTSTYSILLIALDRYIAVIYPIWYSHSIEVKKRLAYGAVAFIWIAVPTFEAFMCMFPTDIIADDCAVWGAFSSFAMEVTFSVLLLFMTYLLPLTAMVFCYSRIVYTIRHKKGSSTVNAAGRNAFVTSLMVCCGYIICWTPMQTVFLVTRDIEHWYFHVTTLLSLTNSCINPFIYAAKYREFQHGLRRLASKLSPPSTQPTPV